MTALKRPRFWIALIFGVVAALLVGMLPPRPAVVLTQSKVIDYLQVRALSSDGRWVVTWQRESARSVRDLPGIESIAVWDRHTGAAAPMILLPTERARCWTLFSPDERVLCAVLKPPRTPRELPDGRTVTIQEPSRVVFYDLPRGRKVKELPSTADDFFFAPDGTLLAVENLRVLELESGKLVKQLPAEIDGFEFKKTFGEHALYASKTKFPGHVRVYAWQTGELRGAATFAQSDIVTQVSRDGTVVSWVEHSWNTAGLSEPYPSRILDTATGEYLDFAQPGLGVFTRASEDGETVAHAVRVKPAPWVKWLAIHQPEAALRIVRWRTNEELAVLPGIVAAQFGADGKHVALVRDDHSVEIHPFPFRTPWGVMALASAAAMSFSWGIAWLWGRRRRGATL